MNRRVCAMALALGLGLSAMVRAQLDTAGAELRSLSIEDAQLNIDGTDAADGRVDWSVLDRWAQWLRRPLDLNRATRAQLIELPGMNPARVDALVAHRLAQGPLAEVWELQSVPGFTPDVVRMLLPFVSVTSTSATRPVVGALVLRAGQSWPRVEGLRDTGQSAYLGGPWRSFARLTLAQPERWSAGVVLTQEVGENQPTLVAANAHWLGTGHLRHAIVGDYTLQIGQGLLLARGLAFARGADPILAAKAPLPGLAPYLATNRAAALRGAAVEFAFRQWSATVFASRQGLDATLTQPDTLWADPEGWTNLRRASRYRTPAELERRNALTETIGGLHLTRVTDRLSLSGTVAGLHYSLPRVLPSAPYLDRSFRGASSVNGSLAFDYFSSRVNLFGELAYTGATGAWSGIVGGLMAISPGVEASAVIRHLDAGHYALRGAVAAARPLAVSNETGGQLGLLLQPNRRWRLAGTLDGWHSPLPRRSTATPSWGTDALLQVDYQPRRAWRVTGRLRHQRDARNLPELLATPVPVTTPVTRQSLRLEGHYSPERAFALRARIEFSRFVQDEYPAASGPGWLAFLEGRLGSQRWAGVARLTGYGADAAGARLAAQAPELPHAFHLPALFGRGVNALMRLSYRPALPWQLHLLIDATHRLDGRSIGSGAQATPGPWQLSASAQVHYRIGTEW